MKKTDKKTTRNIGDVINMLSAKPIPFTVKIADQEFDLFVHPATDEDLRDYGKIVNLEDRASITAAMNLMISRCIRDGDGVRAWDKPEDVKVMGMARVDLVNAINTHIFGLSLSNFSLKN